MSGKYDHIKIIACDLDGTLLLNGAQKLRPDTCGLIRRLQQNGILFFTASGRPYAILKKLFAPVRDEIGYMCENGCLGFYRGKMIFRELMGKETAHCLIDRILARPDTEIFVSGTERGYLSPRDPAFGEWMRDYLDYDVDIVEDLHDIPEEYVKLAIYEKAGIVHDRKYWIDCLGDISAPVVSGNVWMDVTGKGITKATGLKRVLDYLEISPEDCIAIGDNDNDLEMLRYAGHPVAVSGGKPEVRAAAERTVDLVEDFFREILEEREG